MEKSVKLLNSLFVLVSDINMTSEDSIYIKNILIDKIKILNDKQMDTMINLVNTISIDKDIFKDIENNFKAIENEGSIDFNKIIYVLNIAGDLVDIFNSGLKINLNVDQFVLTKLIEYLLILFLVYRFENKKLILNTIEYSIDLLSKTILPIKNCSCFCN